MYKKSITAAKAIEAPAIIIGLSKTIEVILNKNGFDIDTSIIYPIVISGYGAVQGFINWIKNHKKRQ